MRVLGQAIIAIAILGVARASAADDAPPSIRQFDIPTIERLGREMYEQDQLAWKATDILLTKHKKEELIAQKQHGWIVQSFPDHQVVRFVRDTDLGPMLSYDVTFMNGHALTYSEPQSGPLSGEDLAQYNARTAALKNVDRLCAETINTVALRDPQGDGWLVWAMQATTKPDEMIVGGHYRFTITKDGSTVKEKDALSKNCQTFTKSSGDFVGSQVVSTLPVETLVFASLSYSRILRVGTPDGQAWKIDGDKVTNIDFDMAGIDGVAARTLAGFDENCEVMTTDASHPSDKPLIVGIDSVILSTERNNFEPKIPRGAKANGVMCGRDGFFLAPNDFKVLKAGIVLYVADKRKGHPERLGVLEISDGQVRFRSIKGDQPTSEQLANIQSRLNTFQNEFYSPK